MNAMGSARILRAGEGLRRSRTFLGTARFPQDDESLGKSSFRQDAETSTLQACAPRIIATLLFVTTYAGAATLQEHIDAAAPRETIHVEAGVHAGPIIIKKPLDANRRNRRGDPRQRFGQSRNRSQQMT